MIYKFLIGLGVIIGLIWVAKNQNTDPCMDRVNYDNIHINQHLDLSKVFAPASREELDSILNYWKTNPPQSENFEVVAEIEHFHQRKVQIIEHSHANQYHYSAIIFPQNYKPSKKYPLVAWVSGLNQNRPEVDVTQPYLGKLFNELSPDFFIIVPSYRGQSLKFHRQSYCSDGFFGDAFDGATDDALGLLDLSLKNFPIDSSRIGVIGISRGGTVALLMAAREPLISCAIAAAGPTDFFQRAALSRYGRQYRYQFLGEAQPLRQIRAKMLESSPIYFANEMSGDIHILHGATDPVVPLEQASTMIQALEELKSDELSINSIIYPDKGHTIPAFIDGIPILNQMARKPILNKN